MTQEEKTIKAVEERIKAIQYTPESDEGTANAYALAAALEAISESFEPEPKIKWPKDGDEVWTFDSTGFIHESQYCYRGEDKHLFGYWPTPESAEAMRDMVRALEQGRFASKHGIRFFDQVLTKQFLQAHEERNKLRNG